MRPPLAIQQQWPAVVAAFSLWPVAGAIEPARAQPPPADAEFYLALAASAEERTRHAVTYDGAYQRLDYPWGDVADNIGVCTDVVVRAYRGVGVDLQQLVHLDMKRHFRLYPRVWRTKRPDPNIDHRRVRNLEIFFARHGLSIAATDNPADYRAGDIVSWRFADGRPHMGVVVNRRQHGVPQIVHNVGGGTELDDVLFSYDIHGHYRFRPSAALLKQQRPAARATAP